MKRWYVVQSRVNAERKALDHLAAQGFEAWLPECRKRRRHARRTDWVRRPLFPRYLFVRMDVEAERWRSVMSTAGVSRLVGGPDGPTPLADAVVEAIREREDEDGIVAIDPAAQMTTGDRVRVADGPFAELEGIFLDIADRDRIAILLNLLGREVRVRVKAQDVERL